MEKVSLLWVLFSSKNDRREGHDCHTHTSYSQRCARVHVLLCVHQLTLTMSQWDIDYSDSGTDIKDKLLVDQ